jgi:hypothetical protein
MSDIQRWTWDALSEWAPSENGDMVMYAEHVAAVAAAEIAADDFQFVGWAKDSFDAGVKAAREAVEAENKNPISRVTTDYDIGYRDGTNDTVRLHLRAIDALLKEKS